jgi:O-antigen ligase
VRPALRWAGNAACFLGIAALGCVLSLALYQVWQLEPRWSAVVMIAIMAAAISMCFVRVFSDFLLVASLFCLPIASFVKQVWPSGYSVTDKFEVAYSGLYNVGVIDFVLVGLYVSWFYRVFVTHEKRLAHNFNRLDAFILWFIVANLVAAIGSHDPRLGLGASAYYLKYGLLYFYLSRHFEERHLPWLIAAFLFTAVVETLLGSYQFATGRLVGLAVDKGLGNTQTLNTFLRVPGQGSYHRADGTLTEPHALGQLMEMLLPVFLVLFLTPRLKPVLRAVCLAAAGGAAMMVLFSLSRGAYLGTGISLALGVVLILALWGERQVVPALSGLVLIAAFVSPFVAHLLVDRLTRSLDTLSGRVPVYWTAWHAFTDYPLFGIGPGNWIYALPRYDQDWLILDWYSNLVHNDLLLTAVEVGVFGLVPYISILLSAMLRFFSVARRRRDLAGRLALAALIAIVATEITNQADPGFHEPTVNLLFWILVPLSVALPRLRPGAGGILMVQGGPRERPLQAPGMAAGGAAGWDGE